MCGIGGRSDALGQVGVNSSVCIGEKAVVLGQAESPSHWKETKPISAHPQKTPGENSGNWPPSATYPLP